MGGVAQRQNGNRSAHNSTCQKTAHISGLDAEIRRSGRGSVSQFAQRLLSQWLPSSCYSAALSTFFIISFRRWWRSRSPNLPSRRIDSTPRTLRAFIAFCLWGSKNGFVWIWAKPFTKMNLSRCLLVFTRPSGNWSPTNQHTTQIITTHSITMVFEIKTWPASQNPKNEHLNWEEEGFLRESVATAWNYFRPPIEELATQCRSLNSHLIGCCCGGEERSWWFCTKTE